MRCRQCGELIAAKRVELGYAVCLPCGERAARNVRHTIVPMSKSNYIVVADRGLLSQLNPKRVM